MRLGLLLAEVGTKAGVKVADEEMTRALIARARSFPGQEKQVWDYYRNNNQALAELRAPHYEEKVVDHILGLAKVEDRKVTKDELLQPAEDGLPGEPIEGEPPVADPSGAGPERGTDRALRKRDRRRPFSGGRGAPMLRVQPSAEANLTRERPYARSRRLLHE